MALMRTSNPTLNDQVFRSERAAFGQTMTVQGAVNKTGILLICAIATAAWTWNLSLHSESPQAVFPLIFVGAIGGLVVAMVTVFKRQWAAVTAPIYALLQGLVLGAVSAVFEARYPGIAIQAVGLTFGVLLVMLLAYSTGMIRVSDKFRLGVVAATGGIALFYLLTWVLSFFHIQLFSAVYGAGTIGIAFSIFVVIIAALNLVLDFDLVERGAAYGAPKYMEWYSAFALMVTLIWMYFEILRLLGKMRERR
jgi:uncharacterized YccA/Bax inhibitor family protein